MENRELFLSKILKLKIKDEMPQKVIKWKLNNAVL